MTVCLLKKMECIKKGVQICNYNYIWTKFNPRNLTKFNLCLKNKAIKKPILRSQTLQPKGEAKHGPNVMRVALLKEWILDVKYLRELLKPNKAYNKIKFIQGMGSTEKYAATAGQKIHEQSSNKLSITHTSKLTYIHNNQAYAILLRMCI